MPPPRMASTDSCTGGASRPPALGRIRPIGPNRSGRDFVAGDVHGCFRTLERALPAHRAVLCRVGGASTSTSKQLNSTISAASLPRGHAFAWRGIIGTWFASSRAGSDG